LGILRVIDKITCVTPPGNISIIFYFSIVSREITKSCLNQLRVYGIFLKKPTLHAETQCTRYLSYSDYSTTEINILLLINTFLMTC